MSQCHVHVGSGDRIDLHVDEQHISRITHVEARDLVLQLLVFGGKKLRDEIHDWLNDGKPQAIADYIAPEAEAKS